MMMAMRPAPRWLAPTIALLALVLLPVQVFAQSSLTESTKVYDGRLEGYTKSVTLDGGSTALSWLLLIVLTAIALGVLFKSSRRTHLD